MCNIAKGITPTGCVQSLPGLQPTQIWAMNRSDVSAFVDGSTDGTINAITLAAGKYAYKFEVHKNTASFMEEIQSADNSGDYYNQTVEFRVIDDSIETLQAARELLGSDLVFVMRKRNNNFYVLGELEGVQPAEGTNHETGAAPGDDTGRVFNFQGIVENQAKQLWVGDSNDAAANAAYLDGLLETS